MTEILPGVHRIDTALGDRLSTLWLVTGADGALLYDTGVAGTASAYVLPELERLGIDPALVRTVVVSHCDVDHFGGLADARAAFPAAELIAHEADASAITDFARYLAERADGFRDDYGLAELPATLDWARSVTDSAPLDRTVRGGERIDLGGRTVDLVHTPGHTPGSLSVHVPDAALLLISDALLGASVPLADGSPAFPPTYRFVEDYLASIAAVGRLGVDTLGTAHYGVYTGADVAAFLESSRAFVEELDAVVLDLLDEGPTTLEALSLAALERLGRWPVEPALVRALAFPIAGHVERLIVRGVLGRIPHPESAPTLEFRA